MAATGIFSLNVHAGYACRHSGACCTAGWSIPVEAQARAVVGTDWLVPDQSGACPQYDRRTQLCRIHRDYGESMLPESCFHFPRRALVDDRGTFVTLSHFCPTAATLLVDATMPLTIAADPPAFPSTRRYDGLDARGQWPPLLRPDVLFDAESYEAWERFLVRTLGTSSPSVDAALDRIAAVAERMRRWTLDAGSLLDWTHSSIENDTMDAHPRLSDRYRAACIYEVAAAAVPTGLAAPSVPDGLEDIDAALVAPAWNRASSVVLRYAATKAFASWTAYQGRGIRTQVAELFLATHVLRVECARACQQAGTPLDRRSLIEAVRAADWLLMHLVDRETLMASLKGIEADDRPRG